MRGLGHDDAPPSPPASAYHDKEARASKELPTANDATKKIRKIKNHKAPTRQTENLDHTASNKAHVRAEITQTTRNLVLQLEDNDEIKHRLHHLTIKCSPFSACDHGSYCVWFALLFYIFALHLTTSTLVHGGACAPP